MTAAEKILQKVLVGSNIDSSQWNSIQAGLRDRAFFSSKVAEMSILEAAQKISSEYAKGERDLSSLRMELKDFLENKAGYVPSEDIRGTIKDLTSKARLDVIIKTNVAQARGFVQYAEGMTPGAFAAFPAQEFTRIEHRNKPRTTWPQRWKDAGGRLYGGRMIALKTDPVWTRLSIFGTPYPPFDWGSGMGVMDVSKREAIELGLIKQDDPERAESFGTKDEAISHMRDNLGIKAEGIEKLSEETVKGIARSVNEAARATGGLEGKVNGVWTSSSYYDEAKKRYIEYYSEKLGTRLPDARADIALKELGFTSKMDKRHYARAAEGFDFAPDLKGIVLSDDIEKFDLKKSVELGWHPIGCDTVKSVVDHELGHRIDDALGATSKRQIEQIFKSSKDLSKDLSLYAAQAAKGSGDFSSVYREAFAEAYAEYKNNPNPRPIAKKIGEFVSAAMRDNGAAVGVKLPTPPSFNGNLQATVPATQDVVSRMKADFGDLADVVRVDEGVQLKWRPEILKETVLQKKDFRVECGIPQQGLLDRLRANPKTASFADAIEGQQLVIDNTWRDQKRRKGGTHLKHFGVIKGEDNDVPLKPEDLEFVPSTWRNPTRFMKNTADELQLETDTIDGSTFCLRVKITDDNGKKGVKVWTFFRTFDPAGKKNGLPKPRSTSLTQRTSQDGAAAHARIT